MARCNVKKRQITFLDANQISFRIYDRTLKPSLHENESPLVLWVVPRGVDSHMGRKKSSNVYQFRRQFCCRSPSHVPNLALCQPW